MLYCYAPYRTDVCCVCEQLSVMSSRPQILSVCPLLPPPSTLTLLLSLVHDKPGPLLRPLPLLSPLPNGVSPKYPCGLLIYTETPHYQTDLPIIITFFKMLNIYPVLFLSWIVFTMQHIMCFLSIFSVFLPDRVRTPRGQETHLLLLYRLWLEQWPACHSSHSMNMCWINEWLIKNK